MADPSTTQAILVGIERYAEPRSIPDLNGPAKDVFNFCQWLRDRNVPGENISVFVSPLDTNTEIVEEINNLTASKALEATKDLVSKALREEIRKKSASSFILFWSGHGWISPQGDRRLIYADATLDNLKNLNLRAERNAMRTDLYKNLPKQLLIFDACANSQLLKITPPEDVPAIGTHLASQEQMVVFAANPGEYAKNLGEGIFSRELLNELKSLKDEDSWLPDMEAVIKNVQQKFKFSRLREKGETKQTPSYWMYQDWSGNVDEQNFFEEPETSAPTRSEKSPEELLKEVPPEKIRKALVKAFPTLDKLKRMFKEGIGAKLNTRLHWEISTSGDLTQVVDNLWEWAEDNESEIELLQSAYRANSKKSELRSLAEYLGIAD